MRRARALARIAHDGQTDKHGKPYFDHVDRVARRCGELRAIEAAYLHDVVEDTCVTLDMLSDIGFDPKVISAVEALTRRASETYADYIERVAAASGIARDVKIADLQDHLANNCPPELKPRYEKALARLTQGAPHA